jgi:hypothetical protein
MVTDICGLCRQSFPYGGRCWEDWQFKFRAGMLKLCFPCAVSQLTDPPVSQKSNYDRKIEITNVARLLGVHKSGVGESAAVTIAGRPELKTFNIYRYWQSNVNKASEWPAYGFHDWFYSILTWILQRNPSNLMVYNLV